jgi:pimeloyl-ACP methyl ester carboxylesterase
MLGQLVVLARNNVDMNVLRTPDERFANLPGYPFTPNYVQVETKGIPAVRMHYVDAGPADAPTVVLAHGQPTWSFLYREVIPVLSDAGLGLRQLTALIPLTRNDPGAAIGRATMAALERWQRPFLTAYSDGDPPTRGWDKVFQERIPGARGQNHTTVSDAAHFIQEQKGPELGRIIAEFVAATS